MAIVCGFGLDNVYEIEADENGKMIPEDLERQIKIAKDKGCIPLMANATFGTTVFGVIDPIKEIRKICKKHNIWFHVDAAFGGSLLLSKEHNKSFGYDYFKDVDSYAWDPHKCLNIPQQCSLTVTQHPGLLNEGLSTSAEYLFMKDKISYDSNLDMGDKSFQCGRHIDILKLWLYWKSMGSEGISEAVNQVVGNAKYLANKVKNHQNMELIVEPEFTAVSFYYIPDRLKGMQKDEKYYKELSLIAPQIKDGVVKRGSMMFAYQKQKQKKIERVNFLRPVLSIEKTREDCDFLFNEIHDIGKRL